MLSQDSRLKFRPKQRWGPLSLHLLSILTSLITVQVASSNFSFTNMARPIKWVLCQEDDHMKLHDDGQRVTVAQTADDVYRLAYVLGLPLGSINGWKIRLKWKEGKYCIMECHLCTRVLCTLPLPCALHRCVISSGSLPHSHITSLAYRLLFTVETHFLLCFNNSVLQPQHNITTAFIGIFIYHSHHAYHLAPCWSSNDRPYYSSLSHHTLPPSFPTSKAAVSSVIRSSGVFHHPTEKSTSAASLVQIILGRSTAGMGRSTTMGQGSGLHTPEAVLVLFLK